MMRNHAKIYTKSCCQWDLRSGNVQIAYYLFNKSNDRAQEFGMYTSYFGHKENEINECTMR